MGRKGEKRRDGKEGMLEKDWGRKRSIGEERG